jgi:hexokinase
MARYDFTNDSGVLKIVLQSVPAIYEKAQNMSIAVPSITLANDTIKLYNSGKYVDSYFFNEIGLIAGIQPDINAAYEALTDLIAAVLA